MAALPARHNSVTIPLAIAGIALVLYASLYPFSGWRWPPGRGIEDMLLLPWPRWRGRFDIVSNAAGYLVLGVLLYCAAAQSGASRLSALLWATGLGALLSYGMEVVQNFLPGRVPSLLDWTLDSAGTAVGALCGALLLAAPWVQRWQSSGGHWMTRASGAARALLLLWPVGLLFPAPIPFAIGPSWERLQPALYEGLVGVVWAEGALDWIEADVFAAEPVSLAAESVAITLGLLAPCLVAYAMAPAGWRRWVLAAGLVVLGFAATTLSAALNFSPDHALAWVTPAVGPGLAVALLCALLLAPVPQRVAAAVGVVAISVLLTLVLQAPSDPYFAFSLHAWEQGSFIRFHGLAQWVGWLWPVWALGWLLVRALSVRS